MNKMPSLKLGILDSFQVKEPATQITYTLALREDHAGFHHWTCVCNTFQRLKWCEHCRDLYSTYKTNTTSPAVVISSPGAPRLIVPCLVTESDELLGMAMVTVVWGNPRRDTRSSFTFAGSESVGFVEVRHTRQQLRRLILEWLPAVPELYPGSMECTATYHNAFGDLEDAEGILKVLAGDPDEITLKRAYAEIFTRLDVRQCTACVQSSSIDLEDA